METKRTLDNNDPQLAPDTSPAKKAKSPPAPVQSLPAPEAMPPYKELTFEQSNDFFERLGLDHTGDPVAKYLELANGLSGDGLTKFLTDSAYLLAASQHLLVKYDNYKIKTIAYFHKKKEEADAELKKAEAELAKLEAEEAEEAKSA